MKKRLLAATLIFTLIFAGCDNDSGNKEPDLSTDDGTTKSDGDYKNLKLDNAVITIPDGDFYELTFAPRVMDRGFLSNDYVMMLNKVLNTDEITDADIRCDGFWEGYVGFLDSYNYDKLLSEVSDELLAAELRYARYWNDEMYFDMSIGGEIEGYNRITTQRLGGYSENGEWNEWSWRPTFTGKLVETYYLPFDENVSYMLDGKEVKLSDVVTFFEDYYNNCDIPLLTSDLIEYEVYKIQVYKYPDGNFGYLATMRLLYDNVNVDYLKSTYIHNETEFSGNEVLKISDMQCFTLTGDTIDWFWTCSMSYSEAETVKKETCPISISYDEACKILSENISQEKVFEFTSAGLIYDLVLVYPVDEVDIHTPPEKMLLTPYWQFVVGEAGVQEYNSLVFDINASTGKFHSRSIYE